MHRQKLYLWERYAQKYARIFISQGFHAGERIVVCASYGMNVGANTMTLAARDIGRYKIKDVMRYNMEENRSNNIPKLAASIMICLFAGLVGSFFTSPAIQGWYATLAKPPFSPPNWIFAPVWTSLFVLMGISMYLVWNKWLQNRDVKRSLFIFSIQLVLNVLWSFLFFGLQSPFYAFVEIIILWVMIAFTIQNFFKISRTAGLLLVPYILWVSFATILNYYIWNLNS